MRILFTIHHELNRNAGAPGVVMRLAEEYGKLGHTVQILSHSDLPAGLPRVAKQFAFPYKVARFLRSHWREIDVIDASSGDACFAYGRIGDPARPLMVTHSHGLEPLLAAAEREEARRNAQAISPKTRIWTYGILLNRAVQSFRQADASFVLNGSEADWLVQNQGLPADSISCVKNGTSIRVDKRAPRDQAASGKLTLIQIGDYSPRKGVHYTAAAMIPILKTHPNIELLFAGTGCGPERVLSDYPPEVRSKVRVVARYDNEQLKPLLSEAQICIMPSIFEGSPLAKLEAMACGVVPLVSDNPGAAVHIEHEANGLVVPVADPGALRAAVERLVVDRDLRARLAEHAARTVSAHRWDVVAAERLDLYAAHLERRNGGAPGRSLGAAEPREPAPAGGALV